MKNLLISLLLLSTIKGYSQKIETTYDKPWTNDFGMRAPTIFVVDTSTEGRKISLGPSSIKPRINNMNRMPMECFTQEKMNMLIRNTVCSNGSFRIILVYSLKEAEDMNNGVIPIKYYTYTYEDCK